MKVNEIFYSIQGEGTYAGNSAIFVRFSGCNLKCPFCDTDFKKYTEMDEYEIVLEVMKQSSSCKFVVLTGGEPTLQVNSKLLELLHNKGYFVAMETNGTNEVPAGVDWVTCSPKCQFVKNGELAIKQCNELKLVYTGENEVTDFGIKADYYYLQPCDTGAENENRYIVNSLICYVKENPRWKISVQLQKILEVR
jgi:organic radical activating enzyme